MRAPPSEMRVEASFVISRNFRSKRKASVLRRPRSTVDVSLPPHAAALRPQVYSRGVPDVARVGAYRFFFYSNERDEPPHIHVRRERKVAKFWLGDVSLAKSRRFAAHELRELERIVVERRQEFLRAWYERNLG